jgi:amino acid transporter
LGYEVTLLSSVMLNLGQILGAGIYSVPGVILNSVGSIGLLFSFWLLAPLFALGGLMVYSEYASMFPKRSGAQVVYLEQAYPRPQFLVPVTFAVTSVLLSCVLRFAY